MIQAYLYRGVTYLKFGKKASPGPMHTRRDLEFRKRPEVELWRDGTITFGDRPEGDISMMRKVTIPLWGYDYPVKRFKARS